MAAHFFHVAYFLRSFWNFYAVLPKILYINTSIQKY